MGLGLVCLGADRNLLAKFSTSALLFVLAETVSESGPLPSALVAKT